MPTLNAAVEYWSDIGDMMPHNRAPIEWIHRDDLLAHGRKIVRRVDVVLDVGCGIRPQSLFHPAVHLCCEPHEEYIEVLKTKASSDRSLVPLQSVWQDLFRLLPDKSVDSVFLLDLIEHLEKDEGLLLLKECKRVAREQIVVFTPLGFMPQDYAIDDVDGWGMHGAQWQVHKSGWSPDDFDARWRIYACHNFHMINGKQEQFDPPVGALWAIYDSRETRGPRHLGGRYTVHRAVDVVWDRAPIPLNAARYLVHIALGRLAAFRRGIF